MSIQSDGISQRQAAIVAGVSLLLMALCAAYSYGFVHNGLLVRGDAAATTDNIMTSGTLFRSGIFGWLVILICDVLAAWALYVFLKGVNKGFSLLTAWLRLMYAAFLGIGLLNFVFVLMLTGNAGFTSALQIEQTEALVLLFLNAFEGIWSVGLIIFGLHLLALGYLVYKSDYVPKSLGILLLIAAISYFTVHAAKLLLPGYEHNVATMETVLSVPMAFGELAFCFWLLIKGGKEPRD